MQRAVSEQQTHHERLGSVTVPPGKLRTIHLGLYEHAISEPKFRLRFKPRRPDVITSHLARVERDGDYELIYHFQSYGDVPVSVTVEIDS